MNNIQHTYFAELEIILQKAGYTIQAEENGLPIVSSYREWGNSVRAE